MSILNSELRLWAYASLNEYSGRIHQEPQETNEGQVEHTGVRPGGALGMVDLDKLSLKPRVLPRIFGWALLNSW